MADVVQLNAEVRPGSGRGASRLLRREGTIPAVIYGGAKDNAFVSVDQRIVRREYEKGGFGNRVFELVIGKGKERVLPRDIQLHPVTDNPIHVDFLRLVPGSQVRISVPVQFVDEADAPGLKRGGIVNVVRHEIPVICQADAIPERIIVSLAGLDINDARHISQVKLPDGVTTQIKRDFTVATITPPSAVREEALEAKAAAAAAAGPTAEETAAAEAAAAAAPAAGAEKGKDEKKK